MIRAVIFDWAGTMVDHGSRAPVMAFVEAFGHLGVSLSEAEARGPMGLPKRDHIAALLAEPAIAARFQAATGRAPGEADTDAILSRFEPLNTELAGRHAEPIEGVVETIAGLRARGIAIGSTTGYTAAIMARLRPEAARRGLVVDGMACSGDTAFGRPSPLMIYRNLLDLAVWPAWQVVKVDDTAAGIAEGLAAGCFTVGIAMTGNECGLSADDLAGLSPDARQAIRDRATANLLAAGAHVVIDGVSDLCKAIDRLEKELTDGKRPWTVAKS